MCGRFPHAALDPVAYYRGRARVDWLSPAVLRAYLETRDALYWADATGDTTAAAYHWYDAVYLFELGGK